MSPASSQTPAIAEQGGPFTILVVAADPVCVQRLEQAFADQGHRIHHTVDVDEAVALMSQPVHAAVVDLDMAGFDGLTLVGEFWRHRPDLPVLTFGGAQQKVKGEAALRAGVVSHFEGLPEPEALLMATQLAVNQSFHRPHGRIRQLTQTSNAIALLASEHAEPQVFLDQVLKALVDYYEADRGSLFLLPESADPVLRVRAALGIDPSFLSDVQPGQGVTGKVFASGLGQLILSDLKVHPGFEKCRPVRGVTAAMCVPVRDKGQPIGVVNISSTRPHTIYTPRDLETLEFLATYTAEMLRQNQVLAAQAELRGRVDSMERLALAGELTAGISHEIKNPLAFIRSNLNTLTEYTRSLLPLLEALRGPDAALSEPICKALAESDAEDVLEDGIPLIRECLDGVDRCLTIVNDMRNMVRDDAGGEMGRVVLNDVIEQALRLTRKRVAAGATVTMELEPAIVVHGNDVQLVQVVVNLINNAADAVALRPQEPGAAPGAIAVRAAVDGSFARLEVEDNGCGMSDEDRDRCFIPLVTSKSRTGGTGLGLGIVKRIVEGHGGVIEVESAVGQGTTIKVRLPLAGD